MALGKSVTLKDPYGLRSVTAERPTRASAPLRGGGWVNLVFPKEYSCPSLRISEPSADCAVQTQPSHCIASSPHPCFHSLSSSVHLSGLHGYDLCGDSDVAFPFLKDHWKQVLNTKAAT